MAASHQSVLRILWTRFAWRHWQWSPVSSVLLLMILAIGVAAFFSIRLANRAAVVSVFKISPISLTSQSDDLITAPAGTLPETVLPELRQLLGNEPVNLMRTVFQRPAPCPPRRDENDSLGSRPHLSTAGARGF